MYENDTILTLKQQRDPDPETDEAFAYNEVRVVGRSPIDHGIAGGQWTGGDAVGVIITPLSNFGSTLDEPFGKLVALYDVKEIPVHEIQPASPVRVIDSSTRAAGPTPEDVFKVEAPGKAPEPGQIRGRTPVSPLDDPRPAPSDGPLGAVPTTEKVA